MSAPRKPELAALAQEQVATDEQFTNHGINSKTTMNRSAYDQYKAALDDRLSKGRYNLEEAAILIGKEAGERADEMLEKLMLAVHDGALAVHAPGKQARYQSNNVRDFYEEAYWDDLNRWLEKNEPRITWRFPNDGGTAQETLQDRIKPVLRSTAQDAVILEEIRSQGHDPLALPKALAGKSGVKADIRAKLCASRKDVFQSDRVFDDAWQRLRDQKHIGDPPG